MKEASDNKRRELEKAGLIHRQPDKVVDPLFREHPDFFDACDLLQVRYELLRAHLIDRRPILSLCRSYGVSRQTFYTLLKKFTRLGTAGLLPGKRGPHGPSKLTGPIVAYAREALAKEPDLTGAALAAELEIRFGISLHKRTVERLLQDLRTKKNL